MKDYKRFTKTDWHDAKFEVAVNKDHRAVLHRLWELENRIESGELVDRNEYLDRFMAAKGISRLTDKEIAFFSKYNARVRGNAEAEIARLTAEVSELKSSLTHANEECLKWHERAQSLLKDSGGSISGYEKKISALQSENAALQKRLENAVELPSVRRDCELTQIVYRNNYGNIEEETYFHDCYYGQGHDVRGDVYAEARLAELKGVRNE